MMLRHNSLNSHCLATQTLCPLHNHFLSAERKIASSIPIRHRNSLSKQKKLRLRRGPGGVKALLTSTEKLTSVKAVITVVKTVGGALTHLGFNRGLDDIADMLGRSLSVELVAAELHAESGVEKSTVQSYARKSGDNKNEVYYQSTLEIPEDFGEIGGVIIENEHHQEMFVKNIVLDGYPSGSTLINCESWVHPSSDNPQKRVFFTNKKSKILSHCRLLI